MSRRCYHDNTTVEVVNTTYKKTFRQLPHTVSTPPPPPQPRPRPSPPSLARGAVPKGSERRGRKTACLSDSAALRLRTLLGWTPVGPPAPRPRSEHNHNHARQRSQHAGWTAIWRSLQCSQHSHANHATATQEGPMAMAHSNQPASITARARQTRHPPLAAATDFRSDPAASGAIIRSCALTSPCPAVCSTASLAGRAPS